MMDRLARNIVDTAVAAGPEGGDRVGGDGDPILR
jgi:hypothetical protein